MSAERFTRRLVRTDQLRPALAVGAVVLVAGGAIVTGAVRGDAGPGRPVASPVPSAPPHVVAQARGLTGRRHPVGAPSQVPLPISVDGCNHDYGVVGQCVPVAAPGGGRVTCAVLKRSGLLDQPLHVGRDSLALLPTGRAAGLVQVRSSGTWLLGCSTT